LFEYLTTEVVSFIPKKM